jgi:hypothetical protein
MSNRRRLARQDHNEQTIMTEIYCDRCDRTMVVAASGDDDLIEAAERGKKWATARLNQVRADILTTHQMECAGP